MGEGLMSKPWKTEVAQEGGNQAFTQMQLDKIKTSGADILIFAGHVRELAARVSCCVRSSILLPFNQLRRTPPS